MVTAHAAVVNRPELRVRLDAGIDAFDAMVGVEINAAARESMLAYVALLDKWNKVYNLTAVREPERMIGMHILDSLSVLPYISGAKRILDVGTGGGLPGIPLAIARPALQVTMLDAIAKKTAFVRQAIGELELKNADVITGRVESPLVIEKFDHVISRAFADLKDFVDAAGHHCVVGGTMLAMKGIYPHEELGRVPAGFLVSNVVALKVPDVDAERHLVIIQKKPGNP